MNLHEIRILHITNNLGIGGVQKIIYEICDATKDKMGKIVVVSSGGKYVNRLSKLGIEHVEIPDLSKKNPLDVIKMFNIINRIVKKYRINIIHCHHRMAVPYARLLVGKENVIYNNHTIYSDKKLFSHMVLKGVNIIADGEKARDNITKYFGISNKIIVINNAVDEFDGVVNLIPQITAAKSKGDFIVMNSSRLHPQKGMHYFIDAAEILVKKWDNIKFFIVGDGPLREELAAKVKDKCLQDKIIFLGFRNDIKSTISQCDVLVLTSIYEGLPLTPMEAFSVHKAVIGTDIDGTREVIKDRYNGLLAESKNPVSIAARIEEVYLDNNYLKYLSENAYDRYTTEFSLNHFKTKYLEYYKQLGNDYS